MFFYAYICNIFGNKALLHTLYQAIGNHFINLIRIKISAFFC